MCTAQDRFRSRLKTAPTLGCNAQNCWLDGVDMSMLRRKKVGAADVANAERGACVVCLRDTSTGCVFMGPPEWTGRMLSNLGVHRDSVPELIEKAVRSPSSAVGDDGTVHGVAVPVLLCGACSGRTGVKVRSAIPDKVPTHVPPDW
jgi:hypothetical protein